MSGYLGHHLSQRFQPGSNLKGGEAPPPWLFLLPSPASGTVATSGVVSEELIAQLRPYATSVVPTSGVAPGDAGVVLVGPGTSPDTVRALADDHRRAPLVLLPGVAAPSNAHDVRRLERSTDHEDDAEGASVAEEGHGGRLGLAVAPHAPEPSLVERLVRRGLRYLRPSRRLVGASAPGDLAVRPVPAQPEDVTVLYPAEVTTFGPPAYVAAVGGFEGAGWSLVPARGYASQKLVFLPPPGGTAVVKVARTASAAERLDHEVELLEHVDGTTIAGVVWPRVLRTRRDGSVLSAAQSLLDGAPMRRAEDVGPGSDQLRSAIRALDALGATTAHPAPDDVPDALRRLVDRFADEFGVRAGIVDRLRRDVRAVIDASIPAVIVHGDAGPQNLLVCPDGSIGLLDWENAERSGPPVWDVTYLILTAVELATERSGRGRSGERLASHLFEDGPWNDELGEALERAGSQLGFSSDVGWSLVRLFLAYLARRDLPRSPEGRAVHSPRLQLLVAAVERYA